MLKIVVFVCALIILILVAFAGYMYLEECYRLRRKLLRMGAGRTEVMSFPSSILLWRLKDILYEKETELAEECFLTVEKDI
ncbi:hypothetical protein [Butyrivibrio sp. JL13D10]|uniref:hypothetical protein n=1 Tax=Butyrivibrio sp. JL13D10 TaxID=3236815 RepID=UPI0038B434E4